MRARSGQVRHGVGTCWFGQSAVPELVEPAQFPECPDKGYDQRMPQGACQRTMGAPMKPVEGCVVHSASADAGQVAASETLLHGGPGQGHESTTSWMQR